MTPFALKMVFDGKLQRASLGELTAEALRSSITDGRFAGVLPGELQLAEFFSVSRPILRQALKILADNGWLQIEKGRRTRILRQPRLPRKRDHEPRVCLVSVAPRNPIETEKPILNTLRLELSKQSVHWDEVFVSKPGSSKSWDALASLVRRPGRLSWLLVGCSPEIQKWFEGHGKPTLILGSCGEGVKLASIDVDYHALGWHAAGQIRKHGHKRVTLILPPHMLIGDESTRRGFLEYAKQCADAELTVNICQPADADSDLLCRTVDQLLAQKARPTAFFTLRPVYTAVLMGHLLRCGLLPDKVSLLARESEPLLRVMRPALSCYATDHAALARKAVRMIRSLMAGSLPIGKTVRIIPEFIPGETLKNVAESAGETR